MQSLFKIIFGILFFAHLTPVASAEFSSQITGCEADDMKKSIGEDRDATWTGETTRLGIWSFTPQVTVRCQGGTCEFSYENQIAMGRAVVRMVPMPAQQGFNPNTGKTYGDDVVFTTQSNSGSVRRELLGTTAQDLGDAIAADNRSFTYDGTPLFRRVYEGRLAKIWIRVRLNYTCPKEDQCLLNETVLVFIPYNETNECEPSVVRIPLS